MSVLTFNPDAPIEIKQVHLSHDEIARRNAAVLLRSFLPRPNKLGYQTVYRRRILGEKDFRLIRQWLERFEGSAT